MTLDRSKISAQVEAKIKADGIEDKKVQGGTGVKNAQAALDLLKAMRSVNNNNRKSVAEAKRIVNTDEFQQKLKGDTWLDNEVETTGIPMGADARLAQERAIMSGKKFNATDAERETQAARDLKFLTENKANRFIGGLAQGLSLDNMQHAPGVESTETEKAVEELIRGTSAGQAGTLVGTGIQYAMPYMAGGGQLAGAIKTLPGVAKLGKAGQLVVGEAATDAILSAPLNALNVAKEGYTGGEAILEFAKQTGIDLLFGAGFEGLGALVGKTLKSGKTINTLDDIAEATEEELEEVGDILYRLAEESNIRKGKINKTDDVITPVTPEFMAKEFGLPWPAVENKDLNVTRRGLQTTANAKLADTEYKKAIKNLSDYIKDYKGKGTNTSIIAKNDDELMRDGGIRVTTSNNDPWYQDFFRKHGRAPLKSEADELAQQLIDEGLDYPYHEFYDPDLAEIINRPMQTTVPKVNRTLKQFADKNIDKGFNVDSVRGKMFTDADAIARAKEIGLQQEPLKDLGADTNRIKPTVKANAEQFGTFPDSKVPKGTEFGETSQAAKTVYDNAIRTKEAKKYFNEDFVEGTFSKHYKSNQTTVDNVNRIIDERGLDEAYDTFNKGLERGTEETIALGARLIQEYQKTSDNERLMNVVTDYIDLLSRKGRELQAGSIIKRLTPEGRLVTVQRQAKKVADTYAKINPKKPKIDVKFSDETLNAIKNAKTEKEILEANKKAALEIWEQVPPTFMDKLNAWRYMAMLMNPRTWARNTAGNILFTPFRATKDALGAGMEAMFVRGERTKTILAPGDNALVKLGSKDWDEAGRMAYQGSGKFNAKARPTEATIFKAKWLEKTRKVSSEALEWQDELIGKRAYSQAFAKYMKANNITEDMLSDTSVLERVRNHSIKEAERATFRENTAISDWLSKTARRKDNSIPQLAKGLFVEGVMPFKKTPVNILWRGVEYSPAGYVEALYRAGKMLKDGSSTPNDVIDALAAGTTGTGLFVLGMYMYKNGMLTTGTKNGDKDYYNEMVGKQGYAIDLGTGTYTIDWLSPAAMPLLVGAETASLAEGNGVNFITLVDGLSKIADPLIETSMLKGLNDALRYNYGENPILPAVGNIFLSYANQFVPTLAGQIARTLDNTRRVTISTNESPTLKALEKTYNKNIAKIPGLSQTLPAYVDVWGRKETQGNAFEQFISPGYWSKKNITPVDEEIMRLGEMDESVYPSLYYKYDQNHNGKTYRMTPKELVSFQETAGKYRYNELDKLFKTSKYRTAPTSEKVKMVEKIYEEANEKAKAAFLVSRGVPAKEAYLTAKEQESYNTSVGMTPQKYSEAIDDVKKNANSDGSGSLKKAEVVAYLDKKYGNNRALKKAIYAAVMPSNYNNPY